ncbi:EF-hand domain-containing protein [Bradyrhizobium sp. USDA 3364]
MPLVSSLRHAGLAGLAIAALAGQPAVAQAPAGSPPSPAKVAQEQLLLRLPAGQPLDRCLEQLRSEFFNLDADGDGKLTQRDVELHALMEAVQARSVAWMSVLRYDLDGDGFVTEDEVRRSATYESRWSRAQSMIGKSPLGRGEEVVQRAVTMIMALDVNKDGKVSLAEAAKFNEASQRQAAALNGLAAKTRLALALEATTSGELSRAGYEAAGEALFRAVDTDHDGKISQQELMEFRRAPMPPSSDPDAAQRRLREQEELARKRQVAIDAERAACAMPAPSADAKVVLFSAYSTEALSSVTIGPQDAVIHAGRVVIEPGAEPLYLVMPTFSPVIWQFSGAVDRVERLVVSSMATGLERSDGKQRSLAGATGLPKDRVSFLGWSSCLSYFDDIPSSPSIRAVGAVREATGRDPSKVLAAHSLASVSLPSGSVETLDRQQNRLTVIKNSGTLRIDGDASNIIVRAGPSRARDDLYSYSPGGLVTIDPKSVIASLPVQPYEVFPQEAGLVQLLESGALTQNRHGEYIVQKPMRFPAGLHGAHSVKFLVLRDSPLPQGDPGHSCVTVENQPADPRFKACN